jgi:hypothetical protein
MPQKTLSAIQVTRWLAKLAEISAALKLAEDIPGIVHPQWKQVWNAKAQANGIRAELLALAVTDVAVEPAPAWTETLATLESLQVVIDHSRAITRLGELGSRQPNEKMEVV